MTLERMTETKTLARRSLVALALGLGLAGCSPLACTEIGCMNGLTLNVTDADGNPVDGLSGEVTVDGVTMTFDCATEENVGYCNDGSVLLAIEQGTVLEYSISIERGDFAFGEITLDWTESAPNGEACGPICYSDTVDIELGPPTTPE